MDWPDGYSPRPDQGLISSRRFDDPPRCPPLILRWSGDTRAEARSSQVQHSNSWFVSSRNFANTTIDWCRPARLDPLRGARNSRRMSRRQPPFEITPDLVVRAYSIG